MTRTAKLYQGEDKLPVVDYTDLVIWEESEFGTRAHNGEGSASNVVIRDPLGETGSSQDLPSGLAFKTLPSKSLFLIEVDSSLLFRGRVGIKNYSRDGQNVERYRQVDVSLHDTNWDLDNIFVHGYSRPYETGVQRAQGIIASYLSGNPRPTTALNGSNLISSSNLIYLPETEYNRTSPLAIFREMATSENKQFFVTGDTIGGGSLFYDGNDSTAYACPFTISDRPDEVLANPGTYFAPWWNVGAASTEDGSDQIDEIVLFWGSGEDQYVIAHSLTVHTQYGHSSVTIFDDTAGSAAEAQARADSILAHRRLEDRTYNVSIGPLTDAQVVQIKHGQTIPIKARAIPDADDQFRTMRIGQCRYTTPVAGVWFAHLQLGRPWKMQPYSVGDKAATTTPHLCRDGPCIDTFDRTYSDEWGPSEIRGKTWHRSVNGLHIVNPGAASITGSGTESASDWIELIEWSGDDLIFKARVSVSDSDVFAHVGQGFIIGNETSIEDHGPEWVDNTEFLWTLSRDEDGNLQPAVNHLAFGDAGPDAIVVGAGEPFWVKCRLTNTTISMKVWRTDEAEPGAYQASVTAGASLLTTLVNSCDNFTVRVMSDTTTTFTIYSLEFESGYDCGSCIHGGPGATATDDTDVAPAGHEHDYVAAGGTTGQVLKKASGADWDTEWGDDEAGISGITVQDEGTPLATLGTTLNFAGAGVVASGTGATKTITIAGGGGGDGTRIANAGETQGVDTDAFSDEVVMWSEHTPADRAEDGFDIQVGDDYVGIYISEKDNNTLQIYPDAGDYNIELLDGNGSGSGSTGKFYVVDKWDNRRPLSNPVSQSAIGTADLAIANTETVVVSKVFAANELEAGMTFMFKAYATRAGVQSASPVIRIRIGTTTLTGNIAATLTPPVNTLAVGNEIEGMVTIRTAGAGGTALGSLKHTVHLAAVTITEALGVSTATVAVNTTSASQRVELTFISGHASNTYTWRNAVIYRVA